jgi:undecaprenyl-diphosphatase
MDQSLFYLINGHWTHPALDLPMAAFSSWAFWWPFVALAAVLLFIFGGFRGRAAVTCAALAVGLTDGLVVRTIKKSVGRPRPNQVLAHVRMLDLQKTTPRLLAVFQSAKVSWSKPNGKPQVGRSFPSSHTSNNFAVAVVVALFFRRWGWLYFIPAALISWSRIYVGSHYPVDILMGMVVGSGLACLVVAGCEFLWRRFASRVVPKLAARHPSLLDG